MIDLLLAAHVKDKRIMSENEIKSQMIHLLIAVSMTYSLKSKAQLREWILKLVISVHPKLCSFIISGKWDDSHRCRILMVNLGIHKNVQVRELLYFFKFYLIANILQYCNVDTEIVGNPISRNPEHYQRWPWHHDGRFERITIFGSVHQWNAAII